MLLKKLGTVIATAALLGSVMTPAAFADTVDVSNNGAHSDNNVTIHNDNTTTVTQENETVAYTFVGASANSGNNTASGNTGGDVSITTGKASNTVTVSVTGGNNVANVSPCGCENDPADVMIDGNGAKSKNKVKITNSNGSSVGQSSATVAGTGVLVGANSGDNKAKDNTHGSTTIKTKASKNKVTVTVTGGHNVLNP